MWVGSRLQQWGSPVLQGVQATPRSRLPTHRLALYPAWANLHRQKQQGSHGLRGVQGTPCSSSALPRQALCPAWATLHCQTTQLLVSALQLSRNLPLGCKQVQARALQY